MEADNSAAAKSSAKVHNSGAADLEKVTDYAEEKEILGGSGNLNNAINAISDKRKKEADQKAEQERILANVKVKKEEVELITNEFEINKTKAERVLRENTGDVEAALMIRSLPLTALSLLLGFFFVFIGSIKITPKVNSEIYQDMRQEFGRYNKVFPLYKYTNWRPLAKNFRLAVGISEVICGCILILIPGPAKELASVVLLSIICGAIYTHYALNDTFDRMAPSLVFGLLIICRLVILYQVYVKEKKEIELLKKLFEEVKSNEKSNSEQANDNQVSDNETDKKLN